MVHLVDALTLPAFVDTTTTLPTAENNTAGVAVRKVIKEDIGKSRSDDNSNGNGNCNCGGELTAEAPTTKKQSAPLILLAQR